jgi:hypothetical protein
MSRTQSRNIVTIVFYVFVFMIFPSLAAETEPRFPWDDRPASCFKTAGDVASSQCKLSSWEDWDQALNRVVSLYNMGQFRLLERALSELAASDYRYPNGDPAVSAAYWAFRKVMPAPGAHEINRKLIDQWQKQFPNSHFAVFANARYAYALAWKVRGSGYAGSVSKESWELFSIRLREAAQILLKSPKALKDTPLWHNLMLAIEQDMGPSGNPDRVFENAVKQWPRYYDFYEVRLTRLVPRWGGNWLAVEKFINYWSKQQAKTEGDSLYARLNFSLVRQGYTPDQTAMDWKRMRISLDDLTNRYPSIEFKNVSASYACFARDKDAFIKAMTKLKPGELSPNLWLSGSSYEACMRWTAI